MSKKAGRLGDLGSSHGCFPPTPAISGSPNVLINGRPALRVDDPLLLHACPNCPPHPRKMAKGTASVLINGKPACGTGDDVNCGGVLITGSGDVLFDEYDASAADSAAAGSSNNNSEKSGDSEAGSAQTDSAKTNSAGASASSPDQQSSERLSPSDYKDVAEAQQIHSMVNKDAAILRPCEKNKESS